MAIVFQTDLNDEIVWTTREAFSNHAAPGFHLRQYEDEYGKHKYTVFVPVHNHGDSLPVVLFLNGFGENGSDGVAPLLNGLASRIRQTQGTFPFVAVFLQCHKHETNWAATSPAMKRALGILNHLRSELNLDDRRIHLTGLSSGAQGTWHLGFSGEVKFASVFPVASTGPGFQGGASHPMPSTAMFFNRFDADLVEERHEFTLKQLLRSGHDAILVDTGSSEVPHDGHNSWDSTFRAGSTYGWLNRQWVEEHVKLTLLPDFDATEKSDGVPLASCSGDFELVFEVRPVDGALLYLAAVDSTADVQQWKLRISHPQDGPSDIQFSDQELRSPCSIVAALSLRANEWNTLRLKRKGNDVQVFLNEWQLTRQNTSRADWNLILQNSGQFEVRNARGHGVRHLASPPAGGLVAATTEPCRFSAQQVIDSWVKNGISNVDGILSWKIDRQEDGQWSTFHAASLRQDSQAFDIHMKGKETAIRRPWNYLSAGFGIDGFKRGVSRVNHQRWMTAFHDHRSSQVSASRSRLILANSLREDTITFEDSDFPARTIITDDSGARFGRDMPDDLFCRIPQLVYEPFAEHSFGILKESLVLEPDMQWANGHRCCVLRWRDPDSESLLRIFLFSNAGFWPTKCVATHSDGTVDVVNIDYEKTKPGAIELNGWTLACTRAKDPFAEKLYPGCRNVIHYGVATDVAFGESMQPTTEQSQRIVCNRISRRWTKVAANGSETPLSPDELSRIQNEDSGVQIAAPLLSSKQIIVFSVILIVLLILIRRKGTGMATETHSAQCKGGTM